MKDYGKEILLLRADLYNRVSEIEGNMNRGYSLEVLELTGLKKTLEVLEERFPELLGENA